MLRTEPDLLKGAKRQKIKMTRKSQTVFNILIRWLSGFSLTHTHYYIYIHIYMHIYPHLFSNILHRGHILYTIYTCLIFLYIFIFPLML